MRRLLPFLILLVATPAASQDSRRSERTEVLGGEEFVTNLGPVDHLGWGTAEDLFVDLGAGAAVSVFAGNLVVQLATVVNGDMPPGARGELTYNSVDDAGSPDLGPGWVWDFGRRQVDGPWGERILLDADGFEDSFWAGERPTAREAQELAEDLVVAWRRTTTARERRDVGGDAAFRAALAADPVFFGAMRATLLGRPTAPDPDVPWVSQSRGRRSMLTSGDRHEVVMTRPDGGTETYNADGWLLEVAPAGGQRLTVGRRNGRMESLEIAGSRAWSVTHDAMSRLSRIISFRAGEVRFDYLGSRLRGVDRPQGRVDLTYDQRGRLIRYGAPEGIVAVEYDDLTGRVSRAVGPTGSVVLGRLEDLGGVISVGVERPEGRMTCSWSAEDRTRTVTGAGVEQRARFEADRPLPVELADGGVVTQLEWDRSGRLLRLASGNDEVVFERRDGKLEGIVDAGGARLRVEQEVGGIAGWFDPAGLRTEIELGPGGRPRRVSAPGLAEVTIRRTDAGLLRDVAQAEGDVRTFARDHRGLLTGIDTLGWGYAAIRPDLLGRLARFESADRREVEVVRAGTGEVRQVRVDGEDIQIERDSAGLLVGLSAAGRRARIDRDPRGLPVGWSGPRPWTLSRDSQGRPDRLRLPDRPDVGFRWDGARFAGWSTAGRPSLELEWRDERVVAWTDDRGRTARTLDRWGRATELAHDTGRWRISRDSDGLVRAVTDPRGTVTQVVPGGTGRPMRLVPPVGGGVGLGRDGTGRLVSLQVGDATWSVERDRAGRPSVFSAAGAGVARISWDAYGYWTQLRVPGRRPVTGDHGRWGPTAVGGAIRSWRGDGTIEGWGPVDGVGGWRYVRDQQGQVSLTEHHLPGQIGVRGAVRSNREVRRGSRGDVVGLGPWRVERSEGLVLALGTEDFEVRVRRDRTGRADEVTGPAGVINVERSPAGRLETLQVGESAWSVQRDSAGLVDTVRAAGSTWKLGRDELGRALTWQAEAGTVALQPLDGSTSLDPGALGDLLGVRTDEAGVVVQPPGSVQLQLDRPGADPIAVRMLLDRAGRLQRLETPWGDLQQAEEGAVDESPALALGEGDGLRSAGSRGPSAHGPLASPGSGDDPIGDLLRGTSDGGAPADPIGAALDGGLDPIGAALGDPSRLARWGWLVLERGDGTLVLPSPTGAGDGIDDGGAVRIAAASHTVGWLLPDGSLDGFVLPGPTGSVVAPPGGGWPRRAPTGSRAGADAPPDGVSQAAWRWWSGLALDTDGLAVLPGGVAGDPRAWRRPRLDRLADDAGLADGDAEAGASAVMPPVPGANLLLPARSGWQDVSPLEALVLSGDLPHGSDEYAAWLPLAPAPWHLSLPIRDALADLAWRRAHPTTRPPASAATGAAPQLRGLAFGTARGAHVEVAAAGLPAGTPDPAEGLRGAPASTPWLVGEVYGTALAALDDDPVAPGAGARRQAHAAALLLAVDAWTPRPASPLSPFVQVARAAEAWEWVTPSGARLVFDARGELLSFDLGGRLVDAWGREATAAAGQALLTAPWATPSALERLERPRWLPEPGPFVESVWGLAPSDPGCPVGGRGELLSPLVDDPGVGPGAGPEPLADL